MQRLNPYRLVFVFGFPLAVCGSAHAQTPGPPPDPAGAGRVVDLDAVEAKKAFEAGVAAYQKEGLRRSVRHFAQAQLLKPHPRSATQPCAESIAWSAIR